VHEHLLGCASYSLTSPITAKRPSKGGARAFGRSRHREGLPCLEGVINTYRGHRRTGQDILPQRHHTTLAEGVGERRLGASQLGGSDTRHSTPAARRPQHDGGTPWSEPAVLRVGTALRCVCESARRSVKTHAVPWYSAGGATAVHGPPSHTRIPTDASRVFSVRREQTPEAPLATSPLLPLLAGASRSAAGLFSAVNGPACRI
jgi:hypothetical protein